jgi:peptidoglycan/xylan/chitin deacetylase (PgdA/CDA1 family)
MTPDPSPLERGVLTISLDFELIWGTLDLFGPERFRRACEVEREAIPRLLDLFAEYDVPATWCILGHLFLDRCAGGHPETVPPAHAWCRGPWFAHDPAGTETSHPTFYGRSLVERIRACPVPQEIGCHTFSHAIFGDSGCSRETAHSELAACVEVARAAGLTLTSFAFPRNSVGYLDVLRDFGFRCYRGPEPHWYERRLGPGLLRRLAHLWEVVTAAEPPTVLPEPAGPGLWNLAGSMIYFPMHGLRRWLPLGLRVRRAVKGLEAAARRRRVFHLWFHPTNLGDHPERMFAGLRAILDHARALRDRGELVFLPMRALVPAGGLPLAPDAAAAAVPARR